MLQGQLLTPKGVPVANATVQWTFVGASSPSQTAVSDSAGNFAFEFPLSTPTQVQLATNANLYTPTQTTVQLAGSCFACYSGLREDSIMRLALALFLVHAAAAQVPRSLQDGTPVRLRLNRTVSSANAHVGETVDFEVTEPVINQSYVVIPKGAVALGRVTKVETKRRFGRAGALELSIDSVRLTDGRPIPLRATPEKGPNDMSGARVAATIAASPILVWVKGKDVTFEKGTESTAYVNGDARIEEPQPRTVAGMPVESAADRSSGPGTVLTNDDIVQMQKARLSEEIILSKIATSATNFNTETQDLIRLKEAGVNDNIINAMVQKSSRR
jgi:hypothetical protein